MDNAEQRNRQAMDAEIDERTNGLMEVEPEHTEEEAEVRGVQEILDKIETYIANVSPGLRQTVSTEVADALSFILLRANFAKRYKDIQGKALHDLRDILISTKLRGIAEKPAEALGRVRDLEITLRKTGVISSLRVGLDAVRAEMQRKAAARKANRDLSDSKH